MKTDKQIQNCLKGGLDNLLYEFREGTLTESELLNYIATMLIDSNVDSRNVVPVLEKYEEGKEIALGIKIEEGW